MNNNKYILDMKSRKDSNDATFKPKNDIAKVLNQNGYETVPYFFSKNKFQKLLEFERLAYKINRINDGIFVYQYPIDSHFIGIHILDKLLQRKVKIIGIIHDVQSLRSNVNREFINNELSILKKFDGLIVHSVPMMNWLKSNGIISPMVVLGPFDYLNCQPMLDVFSYEKSIVYAGNLLKASFLTNLNINTKIFVLGPHPSNKYPQNIIYLGKYGPNIVTKYLKGSFGLVWDSDNFSKGRVIYKKEYNKYNCPYKLSMYLSSGLPVIVWEKSALASFVMDNNVGIVISSLSELDKELNLINENQYMSMVNNARIIGNKLRNGEFILMALKDILNEI